MIYKPAKGSRLTDEQAQRYGERIDALIEEHNGMVTPHDVLADAKSKKSPLHDFFEWEDTVAAGQWRLTQARYLMRSIHVVIKREEDQEEQETRYLYNVQTVPPEDETPQRAYVSIKDVLTHPDLSQQIVEQAMVQLTSWRKKYQQYQQFSKVFSAIAETQQELGI